jgi:hypothetical protein
MKNYHNINISYLYIQRLWDIDIYRDVEQASLLSGTISPCPVLSVIVVTTVLILPRFWLSAGSRLNSLGNDFYHSEILRFHTYRKWRRVTLHLQQYDDILRIEHLQGGCLKFFPTYILVYFWRGCLLAEKLPCFRWWRAAIDVALLYDVKNWFGFQVAPYYSLSTRIDQKISLKAIHYGLFQVY